MEAADVLKDDGFGDLTFDKAKELFMVIFGKQWVEENLAAITNEPADKIFAGALNQHLASWIKQIQVLQPKFDDLAYQWSPAAMSDFNEGFTEGFNSFLDVAGQLAGESGRSGIYGFLLLVWPEIKAMLESGPRKTLSDLHEWMK